MQCIISAAAHINSYITPDDLSLLFKCAGVGSRHPVRPVGLSLSLHVLSASSPERAPFPPPFPPPLALPPRN